MRVSYDKDMRAEAKAKKLGLITLQTIDTEGNALTIQFAATEGDLKVAEKCRDSLLGSCVRLTK